MMRITKELLKTWNACEEMRHDQDDWVRYAVAKRLEDQTLLAEMRHDQDDWVRYAVAERLEELTK